MARRAQFPRRGGSKPGGSTAQTQDALRERIKELHCLYTISNLSQRYFASPEPFLEAVVQSLPPAWHYPDYASARIVYAGREFRCGGSRGRPWRMSEEFRIDENDAGRVEVLYRNGVPLGDDGPFLPEERSLLAAVAQRIGRDLSHMRAVSELREAHRLLQHQYRVGEETNITLRNVLRRVEDEKREVSRGIGQSIARIVMPIIAELELSLSQQQKPYVSMLRQSLEDICSPLLTQFVQDHMELTPAEVAIATMLRNGLSTKEIARLRSIEATTVRRHRENIRKALKLQNKKVNLVTYLRATAGRETR